MDILKTKQKPLVITFRGLYINEILLKIFYSSFTDYRALRRIFHIDDEF
jgi:hypothetical protein